MYILCICIWYYTTLFTCTLPPTNAKHTPHSYYTIPIPQERLDEMQDEARDLHAALRSLAAAFGPTNTAEQEEGQRGESSSSITPSSPTPPSPQPQPEPEREREQSPASALVIPPLQRQKSSEGGSGGSSTQPSLPPLPPLPPPQRQKSEGGPGPAAPLRRQLSEREKGGEALPELEAELAVLRKELGALEVCFISCVCVVMCRYSPRPPRIYVGMSMPRHTTTKYPPKHGPVMTSQNNPLKSPETRPLMTARTHTHNIPRHTPSHDHVHTQK